MSANFESKINGIFLSSWLNNCIASLYANHSKTALHISKFLPTPTNKLDKINYFFADQISQPYAHQHFWIHILNISLFWWNIPCIMTTHLQHIPTLESVIFHYMHSDFWKICQHLHTNCILSLIVCYFFKAMLYQIIYIFGSLTDYY